MVLCLFVGRFSYMEVGIDYVEIGIITILNLSIRK